LAFNERSPGGQGCTASGVEIAVTQDIEVSIDEPALIALVLGMADADNPTGHRRELYNFCIFHCDRILPYCLDFNLSGIVIDFRNP
jgi:hypothetical protein